MGNKNSGRRERRIEWSQRELTDKAREVALKALKDDTIDIADKIKIAVPITVKDMINKQDINQSGAPDQIIIYNGKSSDNKRLIPIDD